MKNETTKKIGIITLIATVVMMSACHDVQPVEQDGGQDGLLDNWDEVYDAGVSDGRDEAMLAFSNESAVLRQEIDRLQTELDDTKSVIAGVIAERDAIEDHLYQEQDDYMTLRYYNDELETAIGNFDLTELCDNGIISERICKMFLNGDL